MEKNARSVYPNQDKILEGRINKGLTQSELADQAGVASKTVWRIEQGEKTLLKNLKAIAEALDIPYLALLSTKDLPSYSEVSEENRISKLKVNMTRSHTLISGNLVLPLFIKWGEISTEGVGAFSLEVRSHGMTSGASGLVYDDPIFIQNFRKIVITVSGSKFCNFSGWSNTFHRMLKIELNKFPIIHEDSKLTCEDDPTYLLPNDRDFEFHLPQSILNDGYIKKIEIIFGKGNIKNFVVSAALS